MIVSYKIKIYQKNDTVKKLISGFKRSFFMWLT